MAEQRRRRKKIRSVGAIAVKTTLHSQHAQRLFNDFFPAKSLEGLSVVLRILGNAAQNKVATEILDEEILSPFLKSVAEKKEKWVNRSEEEGIDSSGIQFTNPQEITAELTTPRAYDFLKAIMDIDETVKILTAMWFGKVIPDEQFVKETGRLYKRARNEAFRIRALARRVFEELRKQREEGQLAEEDKKTVEIIEEAEKEIERQDKAEAEERNIDEVEGIDDEEESDKTSNKG
jgi:hypothetical protein